MLAIVGGKGGCGKTTTAVGLGAAVARRGERVLLVDADCDTPNLHTVTDTPYSPGIGALSEGASLDRVIHGSRDFPGVDVLPSGSRTGAVPPAVLGRVRAYSGRVLVDCPAGATSAVTAPVRAADAALVVSTPGPESRRDAAKTARIVRSLGTPLHGAVVTRAGTTDSATAPLDSQCRVLDAVPRVEGSVLDDSVGRAMYRRLADRLIGRNA